MMWWSDGSWGHGWWWPGILLMAVFMIVCMVMMARMMMSHGMPGSRGNESGTHQHDVPERILANRLASGEIDIDEYERLRDALQRTADSARPSARP